MTKLVLSALIGLLALGIVAGTNTANAAPAMMSCTGANSVWDDTDIVHLTKEGAGTLVLAWVARGNTTLTCTDGTSTTTHDAQLEQRVHARVMPDGSVRGSGQTRVGAGNLHHSFAGNFRGTATLNAGTLSLAGDFNADGKVDAADYVVWRMHYHDAGVIDLATRQFRPHMFSNIVIDWGDGNPQPN